MEDNFLTKDKFSKEVEEFALETGSTIMDAIILKMTERNLEFEVVKKYLSTPLLDKLEMEAQELKMIRKSEKNQLPI